jgi:hypothetical protein
MLAGLALIAALVIFGIAWRDRRRKQAAISPDDAV